MSVANHLFPGSRGGADRAPDRAIVLQTQTVAVLDDMRLVSGDLPTGPLRLAVVPSLARTPESANDDILDRGSAEVAWTSQCLAVIVKSSHAHNH